MPADALATLKVRASAGMILTTKAGIFLLQHRKSRVYFIFRIMCVNTLNLWQISELHFLFEILDILIQSSLRRVIWTDDA